MFMHYFLDPFFNPDPHQKVNGVCFGFKFGENLFSSFSM